MKQDLSVAARRKHELRAFVHACSNAAGSVTRTAKRVPRSKEKGPISPVRVRSLSRVLKSFTVPITCPSNQLQSFTHDDFSNWLLGMSSTIPGHSPIT